MGAVPQGAGLVRVCAHHGLIIPAARALSLVRARQPIGISAEPRPRWGAAVPAADGIHAATVGGPADYVSTSLGHGLAQLVPTHPGRHRRAPATAAGPMLRASFRPSQPGPPGGAWDHYVPMLACGPGFPLMRPALPVGRAIAHPNVAKSAIWRISRSQRGGLAVYLGILIELESVVSFEAFRAK